MITVINTLLDDTRKVMVRWFETDAWDCQGSLGMSAGIFKEERPYPDSHHIENKMKELDRDIKRTKIYDRVVKLLHNVDPIIPSDVKKTVLLDEDLGFDSLDVVELAMAIEEEFEISIPNGDIEKWITIGDIVNYLEKENLWHIKGGLNNGK